MSLLTYEKGRFAMERRKQDVIDNYFFIYFDEHLKLRNMEECLVSKWENV